MRKHTLLPRWQNIFKALGFARSSRSWFALRAVLACASIIALGNVATSIADEFQNLDFDLAFQSTPVPRASTLVADSAGLPWWTNNDVYAGYVAYDTMSLGSVAVSIHDGLHIASGDFYPLEGRYSVMLQNGAHDVGQSGTAFIAQTGDIPDWAESISFLGEAAYGAPTLLLNGSVIPTTVVDQWPDRNATGPVEVFAADIRAFTGKQNVELRFQSTGMNTLDDIEFSPDVVPEPCTLALLVIGAATTCAASCAAAVLSEPLIAQLRERRSMARRGGLCATAAPRWAWQTSLASPVPPQRGAVYPAQGNALGKKGPIERTPPAQQANHSSNGWPVGPTDGRELNSSPGRCLGLGKRQGLRPSTASAKNSPPPRLHRFPP